MVQSLLRPLMPMIRTDLSLSYTQVGVVISAFAITSGLSQLPAGWLADRFGPRLIVALGVSGVALAGLLIGLSPSYLSLIFFVVLAAILGGGYHPASISAISLSIQPERRGRALGLHAVGGGSSFWVVPLLAAPIAATWGWRGAYITLAIPAIILGVVLYTLIGRQSQSKAGASGGIEATVPTEPSRIRWRQLAPFLIMSITIGTITQSVAAYLSLYAVDNFGVSEATAALLMAISPAVGFFAAPLGGYLSDRVGGAPILVAVGFVAFPLIYMLGVVPNVPALAAVMVVMGFVMYVRMPTSEAYIVGHTPEHHRFTILGLYFSATLEFAGLLAPVIGNLIDRFGFYWSFTIASITLAVVNTVCSLLLWKVRD
ncbi:MAG: MFS transporter [Dehalococcoidia bacterium]|nr:MAG: MFS transporter [Dehalococcoidia bacterium]